MSWRDLLNTTPQETGWRSLLGEGPQAIPLTRNVYNIAGSYTGEITSGDQEYGTFEYQDPSDRAWWSWSGLMKRLEHAGTDIRQIFTPESIVTAGGTVMGSLINTTEHLARSAGWRDLADAMDLHQPEPPENTPRNFTELMSRAAAQAPELPELGMTMIQPYTQGILGANKPAPQDWKQFFHNISDYSYEHPVFFLMDATIVADGLGAVVAKGLGLTGRLTRLAGVDAAARALNESDIAAATRLTETGTRMEEIARGGGPRAPVQIGNRLIEREYSHNLLRQGAQRLWDVTGGKNPTWRGAESLTFLPMDLYNRTMRPVMRAGEDFLIDRTMRYWLGQEAITNAADLGTMSKATKFLKPEDYPLWRQYHLGMGQLTAWNSGEAARILRERTWADGTALNESQLRAFDAAVRSNLAWGEVLRGHRVLYALVPGRYQRWIERGVFGENTAGVLANREMMPASVLGLGQTLGGEFTTRGMETARIEADIVRPLEGRLRLEQNRATALVAETSKAVEQSLYRQRVGIDTPQAPIGQFDELRPKISEYKTPFGERWEQPEPTPLQREIPGAVPTTPVEGGTRMEIIYETDPLEAGRGLAEADQAIEILRDPVLMNARERIFQELGWKRPTDPRRFAVDDETLLAYDERMKGIRTGIGAIETEIDRWRSIDGGAPIMMPELETPAYEPGFGIPRRSLIKPPDPLAMREDLKLLRDHPELFEWVDGKMVSPLYYPHQSAQDLAGQIAQAVQEETYRIIKERPGFLESSEGLRFRLGIYDTQVEKVVARNIRSVNKYEAMTGIIDETTRDFDASEFLATKHAGSLVRGLFEQGENGAWTLARPPRYGKPGWREYQMGRKILRNEGYRIVYPDGFKKLIEGDALQDLIVEAAKGLKIEAESAGAIEEALSSRMLKQLVRKTDDIIMTGRPVILPKSVLDHLDFHFGRNSQWFDLIVGSSTRWWRMFTLPLRLAWQISNSITNVYTTAIHGNLGGLRYMDTEMARQATGIGTDIFKEVYGESFGYSRPVQGWMRSLGKVGEHMARFNKGLNAMSYRMVQVNQWTDDLMYRVNQLAQIERDIKAGKPLALDALQEARDLLRPGEPTIEQIRNMRAGAAYYQRVMKDLYAAPPKVGSRRIAYLQELEANAAECVYRFSAMTPWQRRWLTNLIPFSGWRLFTMGLSFRFPVKYPGRTWVLKQAAVWGRMYTDEMWRQAGVDPDTLSDYTRQYSIPVLADGTGRVISMRSNAASLYDAFGVEQLPSVLLSHPLLQAPLALAGGETFPYLHQMETPPRYAGAMHGKHPLDVVGEMLFGPYWSLAAQIVEPNKQYETGGVFQPEPILDFRTGEPTPQGPIRELARLELGLTFDNLDSYVQMEKAHSRTTRTVYGYFDELDQGARTQNQDRGLLRGLAGTYLTQANQALEQLGTMYENAPGGKRDQIETQYKTLMNQIARVQMFLALMDNHQYDDLRIPPTVLHGEGWKEPQ